MSDLSNRHESTLDGTLRPFDTSLSRAVKVVLSPELGEDRLAQLTMCVLVNLLSRMEGVVSSVELAVPSVYAAPLLWPWQAPEESLRQLLSKISDGIAVVPLETGSEPLVLVVGSERVHNATYLGASGWQGGISTAPTPLTSTGEVAFGPFIAAALAAGEVFKAIRIEDHPGLIAPSFFDAWSLTGSNAPLPIPEQVQGFATIEGFLAGAGAVGCSSLYVLWASLGLAVSLDVADGDPEGFAETNRNRYVLLIRDLVGEMKASSLADCLRRPAFTLRPHDRPVEEIVPHSGLVLSAVDKNTARQALQGWYPRHLLGGSTNGLRAEVFSCGPLGERACLRCFNPPETSLSDHDVRERLRGDSDLVANVAGEAGMSVEQFLDAIHPARCSEVSAELIGRLRIGLAEPPAFAVSFVSCLAGTLLAAEAVKVLSALPHTLESSSRVGVQFLADPCRHKPMAFPRDPNCPMCKPGSTEVRVWQQKRAFSSKAADQYPIN